MGLSLSAAMLVVGRFDGRDELVMSVNDALFDLQRKRAGMGFGGALSSGSSHPNKSWQMPR